ncbi:MAG: hypothetical protein WDO68_30945 [Gammaproteobacteria bacterium]
MMFRLMARPLPAFLALLLFGNGAAWCASTVPPGSLCPVEKVGAWIRSIDPQAGEVRLFRPTGAPSPISAHAGECLLFGDRVQSDRAVVEIETASGMVTIGRYQGSDSYEVNAPDKAAEQHTWSGLQSLFDFLRTRPRAPRPGVSRGGAEACAPPKPERPVSSLRPLRQLAATEQRVGTDQPAIVIAWKDAPADQKVLVTLSRADAIPIDSRSACGNTPVRLQLKPEVRKAGETLLVQVRAGSAVALTWTVRLVAPEELPHPADSSATGWALGAWCLYRCPSDVQLDALSRVEADAASYLAANWILEDALAERSPPKLE